MPVESYLPCGNSKFWAVTIFLRLRLAPKADRRIQSEVGVVWYRVFLNKRAVNDTEPSAGLDAT